MKRLATITALGLLLPGSALHAETTPLTEPLREEAATVITCELIQTLKRSDVAVFDSPKNPDEAKGTYHYKLWLPKGYDAEPQKHWPCMFVMSPAGSASMPGRDYLKDHGFIVVMLVEAKNGPWPPIVDNFLAAHDDAVKRVRIDEAKKIATGFSGGARGSSVFVQLRPGFRGLFLQGAGMAGDEKGEYLAAGIKQNPNLYIAMTMGTTDNNKKEIERVKRVVGPQRFISLEFEGGHGPAPPELFEKAMTWLTEKSSGTATSEPARSGSSPAFDIFKKK